MVYQGSPETSRATAGRDVEMRLAYAALLLLVWPTFSARACKLLSASDLQSNLSNGSLLVLSNANPCYALGGHLLLANTFVISSAASQQPVLDAGWAIDGISALPGKLLSWMCI
jgi:hypothetical protein